MGGWVGGRKRTYRMTSSSMAKAPICSSVAIYVCVCVCVCRLMNEYVYPPTQTLLPPKHSSHPTTHPPTLIPFPQDPSRVKNSAKSCSAGEGVGRETKTGSPSTQGLALAGKRRRRGRVGGWVGGKTVGGKSFSWASILPRRRRSSACKAFPKSSKERERSRQAGQRGLYWVGGWVGGWVG